MTKTNTSGVLNNQRTSSKLLPAGCVSTVGYSSVTGEPCSNVQQNKTEIQNTQVASNSKKETICTGNAPALFLLKVTLEAMKLENKARLYDSPGTVSYIKVADTQVGYSPSLGKCVGGYYLNSYTVTNNYESSHSWSAVVAVLNSGFNSYEIMATYDNSNTAELAKQYEGKLYELTNGEIGKIKW